MQRVGAVILLLALSLGLVSCERRGTETGGGAERQGELRLVALSPAIGLMLQDLGLEDRLVGTHDFDDASGSSIPRVGSLDGIDYEALLAARPTHVLVELSADRPLPDRLVSLGADRGWEVRRIGSIETVDDIARVVDDLYLSFVAPPRAGSANAIGFRDPADRFEGSLPSEAFARAIADRGPRVGGAGRVLLLGAAAPPSAFGPGSFHAQILERIGGTTAVPEGGLWQEMDAEDVLRLRPDGIVLVAPRDRTDADRFGEPAPAGVEEALTRLGRVGELPIPAVRNGRVALIDDPHALKPAASSMGRFAERLASILEGWSGERGAVAP